MIDVHAHFAEEGYSFPEEWERIGAAGVQNVILASDTLEHARIHAAFCETHAGAYYTAGVHPEFAGVPLCEEELRALLAGEKCVAAGEIGLDYHYEGYGKEAQKRLFFRQLELAAESGLPVQIHSRDACADTLALLREAQGLLSAGFLMHCYSYGEENLSEFADMGAFFSFGGVACFKNAKRVQAAVKACPSDRILTETDSPYLSPMRGEKNSPANIPLILGKLAELRGTSPQELERQVQCNAERLFPKLKGQI